MPSLVGSEMCIRDSPCIMCLTSGRAITQHPAPLIGGNPPSEQFSPGFSLTRGPAQVGFRPTEAPITLAHACLMGGPSIKPQGLGVKQSLCLGKALPTPNPTTHEGDGRARNQHLDLCFWNSGPHMAYMSQGPLHYVSDIRKGHSPASSPPHRGKSPLRACLLYTSPSPRD